MPITSKGNLNTNHGIELVQGPTVHQRVGPKYGAAYTDVLQKRKIFQLSYKNNFVWSCRIHNPLTSSHGVVM
jgi:hypothetical protein